MGRIIAIDYGMKRTGLAVTDTLQIIATSLETVNSEQLLNYLSSYFTKENVEAIVVGMPKRLNNQDTDMTAPVRELIKKLKTTFSDKPIYEVDERFTSSIARRSMIESGMKKKDRRVKGNVDMISATIILQDFLAARKTS
jgi:putative holliday junction resolvase